MIFDLSQNSEWVKDCVRSYGKILTGKYAHWCPDWDFLPIDETTPEWSCCTCEWMKKK